MKTSDRHGSQGLFDQTSPFTSAQYFQENLHFQHVQVCSETLRGETGVHLHDEIEMLFVRGGQGSLQVNGVHYPLAKGCLAWLFPFHTHAVACTEGPLSVTTLRYSLGLLTYLNIDRQLLQSILVLEQGPPCLRLPDSETQAAAALLSDMEQELSAKGHHHELVVFAGVLRLITWFERQALQLLSQGMRDTRTTAWTALQYIQFHFNRDLSTDKVASVVGLTPAGLNRALRLLTGMNFQQNLALTRVRNACAMMQYEELTLPYIARYVGYSSLASFYRSFKAAKGTTPDKYRKLSETEAPHPSAHPSDTARVLLIYIGEHYREPITAAGAAKALYLSEAAVVAALDKALGRSFAQLVCTMRLWVAAGLLAGTSLPADDVAQAAGFGSGRTFTRCFKRLYGCTPGEYRVGNT